ncbi:MAG: universal stress protein [Vicinamibacteria bacterium]
MAPTRVAIHNILCPTDFSEPSEHALHRASSLARWFHARLTALHVIPYMPAELMSPGPIGGGALMLPSDLLIERRDLVEKEMNDLRVKYAIDGVDLVTEIRDGRPADEIEDAAVKVAADLVVMGTHGRGGWDRFLMGSTTEKVIRRLPCPVLTIGPTSTAPEGMLFRRIVCALDLTSASQATLDTALSFAEENLAEVVLVHVIDGGRLEWAPKSLGSAYKSDFLRAATEGAHTSLSTMREDAHSFCTVSRRVATGSAWREIVRIAEEIKADLIVVGTQGPGNLNPVFLGSTTNQVVRHAPCPVLLARPTRRNATAVAPSVAGPALV